MSIVSALIQTNPDTDEFRFFAQDVLITECKKNFITDISYHFLAPLLVKEITLHTQKHNWIVFSLFKLDINTYIRGNFTVRALGIGNNFFLIDPPRFR
jgi:hypothetical protein